jgi:hypothetical protein
MTTKDIEVEQSSSEMPSHVNAKVTSNSNSNAHNLKSQPVDMNNFSGIYDVSTARKMRIAKYSACLLVSL